MANTVNIDDLSALLCELPAMLSSHFGLDSVKVAEYFDSIRQHGSEDPSEELRDAIDANDLKTVSSLLMNTQFSTEELQQFYNIAVDESMQNNSCDVLYTFKAVHPNITLDDYETYLNVARTGNLELVQCVTTNIPIDWLFGVIEYGIDAEIVEYLQSLTNPIFVNKVNNEAKYAKARLIKQIMSFNMDRSPDERFTELDVKAAIYSVISFSCGHETFYSLWDTCGENSILSELDTIVTRASQNSNADFYTLLYDKVYELYESDDVEKIDDIEKIISSVVLQYLKDTPDATYTNILTEKHASLVVKNIVDYLIKTGKLNI